MFYLNESDENLFVNDAVIPRFNSMSCLAPLDERMGDDSSYEEILRANIKVWKSSQKHDSKC